ncbi:MAG: hypothetical protein AB7K09_01700 [Planctomycetota bacterium]
MQNDIRRQIVLSAAALVMMAGALFIVACPSKQTTGPGQPPREPQKWDQGSFGMVVPHKTFPADCSLCHVTERWDQIRADFSFDHAKETGYALNGAHAAAQCLRCHNDRGPVSLFVEHGCAGCHVDPHKAELGSDCAACHTEISWQPTGLIAKHQETRFPLYGAHLAVACNRCHQQADVGTFIGAPVECDACHASLAASATNPDHTALGWTDTCERCHGATSWNTPHFHHEVFPLTNAHQTACTNCHTSGDYSVALDPACLSCHSDDYAATTTDHTGFGTNCQDCHNTIAWVPVANFPHPDFPITGRHKFSCATCHTTPGNYMAFSCTDCHTHSKSQTDSHHNGVPGYVYDSAACYSCHPNGKN